ncbi:hypothetical protein [Metapseudomonas resinovorans]|uniref:Uncharacterized protein n=1 Tax=Metapseudomonas resinovorans NBRC 106553 TaxID=1245471 RepID=S6ADD0_METRE|nr:hypothetical protein [Pseudomonas resinovorans]BAN47167.1 hypothetical protein PCA10_14350 [Pseudomonas resinovorans NBRC 106553]
MSISTYEGASAVFTFADNPTVLGVITVVVIAATLYALVATFIHEKHSYDLPDEKLPKLK